jgi:hypothetical protein
MEKNKAEIEKRLLSDKRVVAEIERHLWIESEKVGYDIGFERAKEEWLKNFSKAWMAYHMPECAGSNKISSAKTPAVETTSPSTTSTKTQITEKVKSTESSSTKRRRAKTYF